MSERIFVSYAIRDHPLGSLVVAFLRAALGGARVVPNSPGDAEAGDVWNSPAALDRELADADAVVALWTAQAAVASEVPFQVGASWALGKRLILLLGPGCQDTLPVWLERAETLLFEPEGLLELAHALGRDRVASASSPVMLSAPARAALRALFPDWPRPPSGEPSLDPPPPRREPQRDSRGFGAGSRPALPTCHASMLAGRALSDCLFDRKRAQAVGPPSTTGHALDAQFGTLIAALGGDWQALRRLEDPELWREVAENRLGELTPDQRHVLYWYRIGFELSTLINLAGSELQTDARMDPDFDQRWQEAFDGLCEAGLRDRLNAVALAEVGRLLDGMRAPPALRDYTLLQRAQERLGALAAQRDLELAAAQTL